MSRCPHEESLILFGSGEHDDDVAEHVDGCATCRAVVDEMRAVEEALLGDSLDEPDAAFFDDLAADVMDTIEASDRRADLVVFRPRDTSRRWTLALAAAAGVLLGVTLALTVDRLTEAPTPTPVAEGADGPAIPDEAALPDEATARALAAELGISLTPIDPAAVAEAEVAARVTDESLVDGGLDALVSNLQDTETEALDVGLGDDVFAALAELDVEELAAVLSTLES